MREEVRLDVDKRQALDRSPECDAFYIPIETLRENGRMSGLNVEVKLEHHNHTCLLYTSRCV